MMKIDLSLLSSSGSGSSRVGDGSTAVKDLAIYSIYMNIRRDQKGIQLNNADDKQHNTTQQHLRQPTFPFFKEK